MTERAHRVLPLLLGICVVLLMMISVWDWHSPTRSNDQTYEHVYEVIEAPLPVTEKEEETNDTDTTNKNTTPCHRKDCSECPVPQLSCPRKNGNDDNQCCCTTCPMTAPFALYNGSCVSECPWYDTEQDPSECTSLRTIPFVLDSPTFLVSDDNVGQNTRISISPCPDPDLFSVLIHFSVMKTIVIKSSSSTINTNTLSCEDGGEDEQLHHILSSYYVWFATHPAYSHARVTKAFPVGCLHFPTSNLLVIYFAARLRGLKPSTSYAYEIGTMPTTSTTVLPRPSQKTFRTAPSPTDSTSTSVLVVGDTHVKAAKKVFSGLAQQISSNNNDGNSVPSLILFVGDATYATNTGSCYGAGFGVSDVKDGCSWMCEVPHCAFTDRLALDVYKRGKDWEDMVSNTGFGGRVAWMTTPGNHDNEASWFFTYRPTMNATIPNVHANELPLPFKLDPFLVVGPQYVDSMMRHLINYMRQPIYYSFDHGKVHVIAISTEDNPVNAYERWDGQPLSELLMKRFNSKYGVESLQYKWLEQDLIKALANRGSVPWIVIMTHRPMYHTAGHHAMCRAGGDWYGCKFREVYEPLLVRYHVNLYFAGHSHHYQRSWPVVGNVRNDQDGVIHCVVGTGGYEVTGNRWTNTPNWVAQRDGETFGFAKFIVVNATHLKWQFWGVDPHVKVIDEVWVMNTGVVVED